MLQDAAHATHNKLFIALSATTAAGIFTGMTKHWSMTSLISFLKNGFESKTSKYRKGLHSVLIPFVTTFEISAVPILFGLIIFLYILGQQLTN